jgi:hypothetical protein
MPNYRIGGTTVRRKNWYMPCVIGPKFDEASEEEQARILKATYWADNLTNAEWPVLLGEDGRNPSAKSRLKKKATGWLIMLARIQILNPELFADIVQRADQTYQEQIEDTSHLLQTIRALAERTLEAKPGQTIVTSAWLEGGADDA